MGELMALYVDPDRWGLGVGRALMQQARARLAQQRHEQACLWVLAGNKRAERFYSIDGWAPDGLRRTDELGGLTVEEVRLTTLLPAARTQSGAPRSPALKLGAARARREPGGDLPSAPA